MQNSQVAVEDVPVYTALDLLIVLQAIIDSRDVSISKQQSQSGNLMACGQRRCSNTEVGVRNLKIGGSLLSLSPMPAFRVAVTSLRPVEYTRPQ